MIEQLQDIDNCVGYSSDKVLARYFDTTRKTVWIWAKEGKLPKPYKIGANTTRWKNSEVMDVVKNFLKKIEIFEVYTGCTLAEAGAFMRRFLIPFSNSISYKPSYWET